MRNFFLGVGVGFVLCALIQSHSFRFIWFW